MYDAVLPFQRAILFILLACLTACGGKRAASKEADTSGENVKQVIDITRPPEVTKNQAEATQEQNPDETISYEKWKEQQTNTAGDEN